MAQFQLTCSQRAAMQRHKVFTAHCSSDLWNAEQEGLLQGRLHAHCYSRRETDHDIIRWPDLRLLPIKVWSADGEVEYEYPDLTTTNAKTEVMEDEPQVGGTGSSASGANDREGRMLLTTGTAQGWMDVVMKRFDTIMERIADVEELVVAQNCRRRSRSRSQRTRTAKKG